MTRNTHFYDWVFGLNLVPGRSVIRPRRCSSLAEVPVKNWYSNGRLAQKYGFSLSVAPVEGRGYCEQPLIGTAEPATIRATYSAACGSGNCCSICLDKSPLLVPIVTNFHNGVVSCRVNEAWGLAAANVQG